MFVILMLSESDTVQPGVLQAGLRAADSCLQEHLEEWISGGLEKTKAMALERRITIRS